MVVVQPEALQCRAEAEFRGNVACAARRAYSEVGILVYQTGQDEHKIDASESLFIALQRPSSVGIRPVEYLIERLSANGLLLHQPINLSKEVGVYLRSKKVFFRLWDTRIAFASFLRRTGQLIFLEVKALQLG